jgi:hypothetical protein
MVNDLVGDNSHDIPLVAQGFHFGCGRAIPLRGGAGINLHWVLCQGYNAEVMPKPYLADRQPIRVLEKHFFRGVLVAVIAAASLEHIPRKVSRKGFS